MLNRIANTLLSGFEDPVGLARPLWRDYSRHNGFVDFDVAKTNGVHGMAARAGISWGYVDDQWERNWKGAGLVGMFRTSYHVLYPGQPIVAQADHWFDLHPVLEYIPRVIDLEVNPYNVPYAQIAKETMQMSDIVFERDGVRPIIYSRKNIVDFWLSTWSDEELNAHYWWLAQYKFGKVIEHAGPPDRPMGVREDSVVLHQTADLKPGFPGEVENASADYDRWEIGNTGEMYQWISDNWGDGGGTDPDPFDCDCDLLENAILQNKNSISVNAKAIMNHGHDFDGGGGVELRPTHQIVTTKAQGIKLRSWPGGSEAAMLKNGHKVEFIGQTRSSHKKVVAQVGRHLVDGWVHQDEFKKL